MNEGDAFARVLASLHEATFHPDLWPTTSALIDEVLGTKGNALLIAAAIEREAPMLFAAGYYRGERRPDLEREYLEDYHPWDERVGSLRRLPDSKLVHITQLYSEQQLKTSRSYNEFSGRSNGQNSLNVRMDGPDGSNITWAILNPVKGGDWRSSQTRMIEHLLPHIRQFVRVRQALAGASGLGASLDELLDNTGIGVIHLDRRGKIIEANGPARDLLRRGDGLSDQGGFLDAWLPADNNRLQKLLAQALPPLGSQGQAAGGSMTVRRSLVRPRLALHLSPVHDGGLDFGTRPVAAMVLLVDPSSPPRLDARLVAEALGLSASESQVAVMLAEGRTLRDIAAATDRREGTVKVLIRRAYKKLGISRQVDFVRLVLSLPDVSPRR